MYQQFGIRAYRSLGMPADALPKFDAEFYSLRMKLYCHTDDELFIFLKLTADAMSDDKRPVINPAKTETQDVAAVQLRSRDSISFNVNLSAPAVTPKPMPVSILRILLA